MNKKKYAKQHTKNNATKKKNAKKNATKKRNGNKHADGNTENGIVTTDGYGRQYVNKYAQQTTYANKYQ